MLQQELNNYTNEQLSRFTHRQLEILSFLTYIYDRTAQDVERWRKLRDKGWDVMTDIERSEWLGEIMPMPAASKGMYTHNDMNRVESTVENIAFWFRDIGYPVPELSIKTDWSYTDEVTKEDMDRYFGNIEILRNIIGVFKYTPKTPSTRVAFDYTVANDVEKILSDVFEISNNINDAWRYAGEILSGEV